MGKRNLPRTNFNPTSHKRYIVDAGVVLTNFAYNAEADEFEFERLGATNGGINIEIEMGWRQIEVDGTNHVQVKEHGILEEFNAQATANVKEMSRGLFVDAFNAIVEEEGEDMPDDFVELIPQRTSTETRFKDNVTIVGYTNEREKKPIIIILENAAVQEGFSGDMEDNEELTVEQTYVAHASLEELYNNPDYLPVRVLIPNELGEWEEDDILESEVEA